MRGLCTGSRILLLLLLPRAAAPQRGDIDIHPEVGREDPVGIVKRFGQLRGKRVLPPDVKLSPDVEYTLPVRKARNDWKLGQLQDHAAKKDWIEVANISGTLDHSLESTTDMRLSNSLLREAATALSNQANQAREKEDWQNVQRLIEPLFPFKPPPQPLTGGAGDASDAAVHADNERLMNNAKALFGEASLHLAEHAYSRNDAQQAVPLFWVAFNYIPIKSPLTVSHYKKSSLAAVDSAYKAHDWTHAALFYDAVMNQHEFTLTSAEREQLSLVGATSHNRSDAATLPPDILVLDRITTEGKRSYFQLFGDAKKVDLLVKADTIDELLAHPSFRQAKEKLAQEDSDLLLTPSITDVPGWQETVRQNFPRTALWSDPYIADASQSLKALQAKLQASDFGLALLLPKNAKQQAAMALDWTEDQRGRAWASAQFLQSNAPGASLITSAANRTGWLGWATDLIGTDSKKDISDALASTKGVIILFAHGDRDGIYTPEGQKLTVQDVSRRGLDLKRNRPVVLLLSCEGSGPGTSAASVSIAQELKRQGATAVLSYSQKVDAGEASAVAVKFLHDIRDGKTPLESFRSITHDAVVLAGPKINLKVRLDNLFMRLPPGEAAHVSRLRLDCRQSVQRRRYGDRPQSILRVVPNIDTGKLSNASRVGSRIRGRPFR